MKLLNITSSLRLHSNLFGLELNQLSKKTLNLSFEFASYHSWYQEMKIEILASRFIILVVLFAFPISITGPPDQNVVKINIYGFLVIKCIYIVVLGKSHIQNTIFNLFWHSAIWCYTMRLLRGTSSLKPNPIKECSCLLIYCTSLFPVNDNLLL